MATYAWGDEPVAMAIVEAVAAEEGCDPEELTSLYRSIDPDALETFFESDPDGRSPDRRVVFTYADYEITVSNDEGIGVARSEPVLAD